MSSSTGMPHVGRLVTARVSRLSVATIASSASFGQAELPAAAAATGAAAFGRPQTTGQPVA